MSRSATGRGAHAVDHESRKEREKDQETGRRHSDAHCASIIGEANEDVERAKRCG